MNALWVVLPHSHHLLCFWHINNNFVSFWRKHCSHTVTRYQSTRFVINYQLVQVSTEHEYNCFYKVFNLFSFDKYSTFFDHPADKWPIFKEKFISCWANGYLHFGNTAKSWVAGGHGSSISTLTGVLMTFFVCFNTSTLFETPAPKFHCQHRSWT